MPPDSTSAPRRFGPEVQQARFARQLAAIAVELAAVWKDGGESADELAQIAVFGTFLCASGFHGNSLPRPASKLLRSALDGLESKKVSSASARLRELIGSREGEQFRARRSASAAGVAEAGGLFETFLHEYDRTSRRKRGIFFTPREVAGYIVRSVMEILRANFADASPIHIIDPACGCGIFLAEWIEQSSLVESGLHARLDRSRLIGFEILPATWLISQLLLSATIERTNVVPLAVHLANPLDDGERWQGEIIGTANAPALPVIVGNPPYSNFGRLNRSAWIRELLGDYKMRLDERKINLDDDFIKFLRWGQYWIDRAGQGILAMITSNTYLRGLTHRRMRESLLASFDDIYILDLHGSTGGSIGGGNAGSNDERDKNVFAIKTGVAIGIFVKRGDRSLGGLRFSESVGGRTTKLAQLDATTIYTAPWTKLVPQPPVYLFAPAPEKRSADYESFLPLDRIFREYISGVQTKNDALFVGFTRNEVAEKVRPFLDARQLDAGRIRPYLVAPFDRRWIYYDPQLLGRARHNVMRHMLHPNVGLVFMRQSTNAGEYDHFLAVDCLVSDRVFFSRHGAPFLAPLWLWGEGGQGARTRGQETGGREGTSYSVLGTQYGTPTANFSDDFISAIAQRVPSVDFTPPDIFHYLYATVHSLDYRQTYADNLRIAFPRVPLPRDGAEFQSRANIGRQLVALHLNPGSSAVGCTEYTTSPRQETEEFTIGGYPVLRRWKKQRRKRDLTAAEHEYCGSVEKALQETQILMREITSPRSSCGSGT